MNILIADDEPNIRKSLAATFRLEGYEVEAVANGQRAVDRVAQGGVDLVVMDLQMPELDGMQALEQIRKAGHELPVIFLSAHGTIERAVEAVRLGGFDFIEKPPHADKMLLCARNALRQVHLEEENRELRGESARRFDMIGESPPMQDLYEKIRRTAPTQARVLILGENGTGKELIARALHRHSPRSAGPFVRVNCAAIPRDLFESELFGHERGAFTGATSRRRGKFVRADRGTLFLDEVGEIPGELQAKLLRSLESSEVEPVGADREIKVDTRVLAATNRDLEEAVHQGGFRQDLYYRLQVVTLEAPPLRARKQDLPALTEHFLEQAAFDNNLPRKTLDSGAMAALAAYDFPGNVRELRNLVERLVILTHGPLVDAASVRDHLPTPRRRDGALPVADGPLRDTMTDLERQVVLQALERNGWQMTATAAALGLERSHLYKKLKALSIEKP